MTAKLVLTIASISGIISVGLGAFGAHALKSRLEETGLLSTYQTAVQYQFYHTLALLLIGVLMLKMESQWLTLSSYAMIAGLILFSGSLYFLCFSSMKWLGIVTPFGGLGFILGWFFLLLAALKNL